MNIIDKNEYQTILNLYNEGCPRSVIAKKYGVSRSQIDTILKRCGVENIIKPTKKNSRNRTSKNSLKWILDSP